MKLRLDVTSDLTSPSINLLFSWVQNEPGLSIGVTRTLEIPRQPTGVSLTIGLTSSARASRLAAVLARWLHSQANATTIKITAPDGTAVRAWAGTDAEQLGRLLNALVDAGAGTVDDLNDATHQARELVEAESGVIQVAYLLNIHHVSGPDGRRWTMDGSPDIAQPEEPEDARTSAIPVTIYLEDEEIHDQVETAVEALLATAGLQIERRDEPVIGSWYRRMWAAAGRALHSPATREGALIAAHAADTRLVLAQDAVVTATLLQNLGPVIASLQPTRDAVLRVGALLIVKVDWVVNVHQLTAAQQVLLDHRPGLIGSPHEILATLDLPPSTEHGSITAMPQDKA
jgi:hypothetical protein